MPCYFPLTGYQSRELTPNGKRKIVFRKSHGFVDKPVTVPCGQCIGCRIDRSRMWAIRCVHESKMHSRNSFLTLTYDNEHLPEDYSLDKKHLQSFFKRLRHIIGSFRYYACGEYGDQAKRPHYHVILFGHDFCDDRKLHSKTGRGHILYTSESLSQAWGHGHCLLSAFSYATAAYTARYAMKKQAGRNAQEHEIYSRCELTTGEIYQVRPEFALMSLRPGIGSSWYDKFKKDVFPSDFLVHEGKKHPVPRYYLDKLLKEDIVCADKIKSKRRDARSSAAADNTIYRLNDREKVKKAQIKQLKRSL